MRAGQIIAALTATILTSPTTSACKSREQVAKDIQRYCEIAEDSLRPALTREHLYGESISDVYRRWAHEAPSDEAIEAINAYFDAAYNLGPRAKASGASEEEYKTLMDRAMADFGGTPTACEVLFEATVRADRDGARTGFVFDTCREYRVLSSENAASSEDASVHDRMVRAALGKTVGEYRFRQDEGKFFIESFLSVEPVLRGKTFTVDFEAWLGSPIDSMHPCRELQIDVERLYKNHMEKQRSDTP